MDTVGPMNSGSKWSTKKDENSHADWVSVVYSSIYLLYLQCGKRTFAFQTNTVKLQ